jgi:hypothetical protein
MEGPLRALVLGGYGATGARIVTQLREAGDVALAAGRDPERADRVVDLRDLTRYRRQMSDVDVVINASGIENPAMVRIATNEGTAFVDITATIDYVRKLEELTPPRPVVVSVGLAPGLTNLLAAEVHRKAPGPIDIVIMLGAGERHGVAATTWSYQLLGKSFRDPASGSQIRNYTHGRSFDLPGWGRRRAYRANFSDQHTLSRDLSVPVRSYFGLDSKAATLALAALTWVPLAAKLPRLLHLPGTDQWLAFAASGTVHCLASGRGQSQTTAVMAALAARVVLSLRPGVHHLHRAMTLGDVPRDQGIHLER